MGNKSNSGRIAYGEKQVSSHPPYLSFKKILILSALTLIIS